jgi:hypothetical protein
MPSPRDDVAPSLTVLSAALLAGALQWTNGQYKPDAVLLVGVAWLVALAALFVRAPLPAPLTTRRSPLEALVVLVISVQLVLLATEPPTLRAEMVVRHAWHLQAFYALLVGVGAVTALGLRADRGQGPPWLVRGWFPAVVVLHLVMGAIVLGFVARPEIDVWTVEMDSAKALLSGVNPFSITFPDPYHGMSDYFPPGVSVNGRLQFGFVYPPLVLLFCLPGYILGGDPRWSLLVAMEIAALLIGYARPGRLPKLAAVGFLFMPRTFFVMDRAWSDALVVMLTAMVAFSALRRPRWLFFALGLYVCLKQHMFIGIPALFLLLPRPVPWGEAARLTAKGAAVAGAVTLPFFLWGPRAFVASVIDIREMFRTDSLAFLAWLHNHGIATLSKWAGLLAIFPVVVIGLRRAPLTVGGFALLAGVTHFTLYIWSTHAFCNEYYNVVGSLWCAVAMWGAAPARAQEAAVS